MNKKIALLKNTRLLAPLSEDDVKRHLNDGSFRIVSYKKNSIVHIEGEVCKKFELILSGKVIVNRIDEAGNLMTISEFIGGDILGGNLLFSQHPIYPMTVSTEQNTDILEISKDALFDLLSTNSEFLLSYLTFVADHTFILGDKIKRAVNLSIRESIFNFLQYESRKQNSERIVLPMSKKALAESLGIQRTSLSRELAKMKKDGLIDYDRDSITLR